ncbi:hypothetical protein [Nocardioides terrisoli]|nr:hypothetical protein [Nocardioides marmorisolisilvae]
MKKIAKVLTALVAVSFAVGLGVAPASTASAGHQVGYHMSDTGWGH